MSLRGWVAQLVEQWTENPRVAGSIPAPATFLFCAEGGDGIYAGRATRWQKTGKKRGETEH